MKTNNKSSLIKYGVVCVIIVGVSLYVGFNYQKQTIKLKIKNIQEISNLEIAAAFVRSPSPSGRRTYQLDDDPKKIKEALLNCEKKPLLYTMPQKLVLVFYYKNDQYKILEVPFEIDCNTFLCKYGTSKELKEYLTEIPDPYAMSWETPRISDSNDLKAPLPENR